MTSTEAGVERLAQWWAQLDPIPEGYRVECHTFCISPDTRVTIRFVNRSGHVRTLEDGMTLMYKSDNTILLGRHNAKKS